MSSTHVESIKALGELRTSLLRFKSEVLAALAATEQEARQALAWLQERRYHWQRELERRTRELQQAEDALRQCQSRAYRDPETGRTYVPDCSREQQYMMLARRRVEEAEKELRTVQEHLRRVEEAFGNYLHQASRQSSLLDGDLLKATSLLDHSVAILMSYASGGENI